MPGIRVESSALLCNSATWHNDFIYDGSTGAFARVPGGKGRPADVGARQPVASLEALLEVQEVPHAETRKVRVRRHSQVPLDHLDDLRVVLLLRRLPLAKLERLSEEATRRRE